MPKVHPPSMYLGRISCRERPLYGASKYLMSAHENIHVEEATYHATYLSSRALKYIRHWHFAHTFFRVIFAVIPRLVNSSHFGKYLHIWQAHQHQASTPPLISIIWWQASNYDSIILYTHDVMASRGLQIYWRVNMLASLMECYSYFLTLQYGVAGYLWYFSAVATPWFIFISTIK